MNLNLWRERKNKLSVRSEASGCAGSSFVTLLCHSVRPCVTSCQALTSDVYQKIMCSAITPCTVISLFRSRNVYLKQIKLLGRWRCRSQWTHDLRRGSAAARLLGLWFRIPPEAWMSHVSAVCYLVEVSASGWPIVQWNPTEYGLSECDREASIIRRSWVTTGCCVMEKNEDGFITSLRNVVTNLLSYTVQ